MRNKKYIEGDRETTQIYHFCRERKEGVEGGREEGKFTERKGTETDRNRHTKRWGKA